MGWLKKVKWQEIGFLIAFALILFNELMSNTMFKSFYRKNMYWIDLTQQVAWILLVIKIIWNTRKDKLFFYLSAVICILIILFIRYNGSMQWFVTKLGVYNLYVPNYKPAVYMLLLVLAAKDVPLEKIMWIFIAVVTLILAATTIGAISGAIVNINLADAKRTSRYALGMIHPACFAGHTFMVMLVWSWLNRENWKGWKTILLMLCSILLYWVTKTNTILLGMIFLIIGFCLIQWKSQLGLRISEKMKKLIQTFFKIATIFSGVIISAVMFFCFNFYRAESVLAKAPDTLKSRFILGKEAIKNYGIKLFGQNIEIIWHPKDGQYFVMDCTYQYVLYAYGIIIFLLFMGAYIIVGLKFKNDYYTLVILGALAIVMVMQCYVVETCYNPFLLALFAMCGDGMNKLFRKSKETNKIEK